MRLHVLALVSAAAAALAGAAVAQGGDMMMNTQPLAHDQGIELRPRPLTPHDRYLMKLAALRDKTIKTKAKDGGQLTPEHAAALQRELDALNREFGIGAG